MNPIEIIIIVVFFLLLIILSFSTRFIIFILKNIRIFLPITKSDYTNSVQLYKESKANNPQFKQVDLWVIRNCSMTEYLFGQVTEAIKRTETYNLLFFSVIISSFLHLINGLFIKTESEYPLSSSFSFIFVGYIIYVFSYELITRRKEIKTTAMSFFIVFSNLFTLLYLTSLNIISLPKLLNINNENICKIFNERISKINQVAKEDFDSAEVGQAMSFYCDEFNLNLSLIFIFSLVFSFLTRTCVRRGYFDLEITIRKVNYEQIVTIYRSNFSSQAKAINNGTKNKEKPVDEDISNSFIYRNLIILNKLKMILGMIIFGLLIDCLSLNELKEIFGLSENQYYYHIVFPLVVIEFILDLICLRFHSAIYLNNNYFETINFFQNTSGTFNEYLHLMYKEKVYNNLNLFWDILYGFFNFCFTPFVIILCLIINSIVNELMKEGKEGEDSKADVLFKNNVFETVMYIVLLAYYFSKGFVSNCYVYYLSSIATKLDKYV